MIEKLLLYIDPGTGSYLIQAIIAAVLGVAFYFRNAWWKFKSFFSKNKKDEAPKNDDENA